MERLLMGSVTERVVGHAECAVLVVKTVISGNNQGARENGICSFAVSFLLPFFRNLVLIYSMFNILIISDEAKGIYSLFKSGGFTPDTLGSKQKSESLETGPADPALDSYDMAFLDLAVRDWQQRLLELRQLMPVVVFSTPVLTIKIK